ncbi:methyltransferase domain-containing protein [Streptomyces sp. UNOC14_S4]|uniref:methyltransferase domain-containing protein n=1 Tax=Streptomyces sp. UNOC14_S4 TaxID=2872340 RepID=UPI001E4254FB|nr:methyltransferase domain-containing protein [Streptomyces sp. UNOC14_S4]MCC3766323.1 methyltransferase domain-containing protein [Streptomyces sp. UNOC14_S4]
MDWKPHARRLAEEVADPVSRWRPLIAETARHELVPRWWSRSQGGWVLHNGAADPGAWSRAVYSDRTLVTRVGPLHADHAEPGRTATGPATSSSTLPSLVIQMYRHGRLYPGADLLDVATGSGYGTALAARLLGDRHVTAIDVDPYLTEAARDRLDRMGLHPGLITGDATGPLPGDYDRIVSMVSVWPVPASWLSALRPGGRLVTTIANTSIVLTAWKTDDGRAVGKVEPDWAGFMSTRHGADCPPGPGDRFDAVKDADGDSVTRGRYPVVNLSDAWELRSMLELAAPGVQTYYRQDGEQRTAWLLHQDGSWARATARFIDPPDVHQGGPRQLWDVLERIRHRQNTEGGLPLHGSRVEITPDGACHLSRGRWTATIS